MGASDHESLDSGAKRRRLRKGTHSCWACKRRKVRCTFAFSTDATCIICRRRGTKCISQELPEDLGQTEDSAGRIVRVEALLNQLAKKVDHRSTAKEQYGAQPKSKDGDSRRLQPAASAPTASTPGSRSRQTPFIPLHHGTAQETFPSQEEAKMEVQVHII